MEMNNHRHTGTPRDGGGDLSPAILNVDNGALYAGKNGVGIGTADPISALDVKSGLADRYPVVNATYVGADRTDKIAVQGVSTPGPDFGTGGSFRGGHMGMVARAEERGGIGERIGGEFWAQYGRTTYGIRATTYGSDDPEAGMHIAGYFHADRENNRGDFWAGYFLGRVHISENVGIGTIEPTARLDVNGDVKISGSGSSLMIRNPQVPANSGDSMGEKGRIAWDENYLYVKTKAGPEHVWKRAALETW
jgi:hypothetical protein